MTSRFLVEGKFILILVSLGQNSGRESFLLPLTVHYSGQCQ